MIHRTERPLTEKEQKRLYRKCMTLQRRHKRSHNLRRHLIAGGIVFGLLWLATLLTADEPWWVITTFWLVVGSLITAQTVYTEHRKQLRFISAVRDALVRNVVEETSVTSNAMVELEEIEDLGACYAFQVEDGKLSLSADRSFTRQPVSPIPISQFSKFVTVPGSLLISRLKTEERNCGRFELFQPRNRSHYDSPSTLKSWTARWMNWNTYLQKLEISV